MYAIKQHKEPVSRVIQQPKGDRMQQFGVISNNMRRQSNSKWLGNTFSTIQFQPKIFLDWTPNHLLSRSVISPSSGNSYSLAFTSGYEIYDARIIEEHAGIFQIVAHGRTITYNTHLIIDGFRSANSSSLARWDVYGYGLRITHLEGRRSE